MCIEKIKMCKYKVQDYTNKLVDRLIIHCIYNYFGSFRFDSIANCNLHNCKTGHTCISFVFYCLLYDSIGGGSIFRYNLINLLFRGPSLPQSLYFFLVLGSSQLSTS